MSEGARFLVPAIRWDAATGFAGQREIIETSLSLGCGGFIIFGGEAAAVRDLTSELRSRSSIPLLIASDLERGTGQQFPGATGLPPLAAVGASREAGAVARAAALTAREALALGVNWVVAPVCDIDLEKSNPIVGTRSFGGDVDSVCANVAEWVDACQARGAMACAKHFPGHGRTSVDSHAELPVVNADAESLWLQDLAPFRVAIESGVASILTAHVAFSTLDPSGAPATLSRAIVHDLLRIRLGFDGIIVTDAMIMDGVLRGRGAGRVCAEAIAAGCDLALYPVDVVAAAEAIDAALRSGEIDAREARLSRQRRDKWAAWAAPAGKEVVDGDREWAATFARSCVHEVRGTLSALTQQLDILVVDDDVGGPYPPPSREPFREALLDAGFDARWVSAPSLDARRSLIVALFGDIRSWKGRAGYSASSLAAVSRALDLDQNGVVVQFSHPRLAVEVTDKARHVVSAWGGERVMQTAAADWLGLRQRG